MRPSLVKVPLTQGKFALIDGKDAELVMRYKWHVTSSGYAGHNIALSKSKWLYLKMHRILTSCPEGFQVDHINGDRLDNRRANLRICRQYQNVYNQRVRKNNTSGYKGVVWHKLHKKWSASIQKDGIKYFLGLFIDKEKAHKAYKNKASELFGEYCRVY